MNLKNIVFDLGGVLVDWNPRYLYQKIFGTSEEVDWFLANICTHEWNAQQDAGRTMEEATEMLIERHPEYTDEITAYYDRWTEMFSGHIEGTVQILSQLRSKGDYRLLALTNWSGETFPAARRLFEFLHWFEGIVVSGDEKLIKPDPRIYQVLFNRYEIKPHQSVFIDDTLPNVEKAGDLGMHGIHFSSPGQLQLDLRDIGVL
jgi:2-haloacid dehalogenase